jgi:hypothetical protein
MSDPNDDHEARERLTELSEPERELAAQIGRGFLEAKARGTSALHNQKSGSQWDRDEWARTTVDAMMTIATSGPEGRKLAARMLSDSVGKLMHYARNGKLVPEAEAILARAGDRTVN